MPLEPLYRYAKHVWPFRMTAGFSSESVSATGKTDQRNVRLHRSHRRFQDFGLVERHYLIRIPVKQEHRSGRRGHVCNRGCLTIHSYSHCIRRRVCSPWP
jgi:hypothetical protein